MDAALFGVFAGDFTLLEAAGDLVLFAGDLVLFAGDFDLALALVVAFLVGDLALDGDFDLALDFAGVLFPKSKVEL